VTNAPHINAQTAIAAANTMTNFIALLRTPNTRKLHGERVFVPARQGRYFVGFAPLTLMRME
jgi:hypothetical protein